MNRINKNWSRRECPVCGNSRLSSPEVVSPHPAEHRSFDELVDLFVGFREGQTFFSYYRCGSCDLLFCPFYFSQPQLDELYSKMPDNLMGEKRNVARKTQEGYANFLFTGVKDATNYLEFGPDIGLLTNAILNQYSIEHATLIEPNLEVYKELSQVTADCPEVLIQPSFDTKWSFPKYDLLSAVHVFDHLLDPRALLLHLLESITSDCNFLIVVHDENSLLRKLMKTKWPPFCLQHPQLFNQSTITILLKSCKWKVTYHRKSINYQSFNSFIESGFKVMGLPTAWTRLLPKFQIPMPLGNQILVANNSI